MLAHPARYAQKEEDYLSRTGIGETAYIGPEAEFCILDGVRDDQTADEGDTTSPTRVSAHPAATKAQLEHKPRHKEGDFR